MSFGAAFLETAKEMAKEAVDKAVEAVEEATKEAAYELPKRFGGGGSDGVPAREDRGDVLPQCPV